MTSDYEEDFKRALLILRGHVKLPGMTAIERGYVAADLLAKHLGTPVSQAGNLIWYPPKPRNDHDHFQR